MKPVEFAQKASITLTADQAKGILNGMGVKLPSNISLENLSSTIRNTPAMTPGQIEEFMKQAKALIKK